MILDVKISPVQYEFISSTDDKLAIRGGRGSGKSWISSMWLYTKMMEYPKATFVVIGPDYGALKRGFQATFCGVLDQMGIRYKFVKDDMSLYLIDNNTKLQFLSAELKDRVRSLEADFVFADELAVWPDGQSVFEILIGSMRPSPNAKIHYPGHFPELRAAFNPPVAGNWVHSLLEERKAFKCLKASTRDNTIGFSSPEMHAKYIESLENNISPDRWAQEIEGEWGCVLSGGVYKGFEYDVHTKLPGDLSFKMDRSKPIIWSLDFNVNLMCSVVMQMHTNKKMEDGYTTIPGTNLPIKKYKYEHEGYQERIFVIKDELAINGGVPDVIQEFLARYGEHAREKGVVLYGDASGGAKSQTISALASVRSNWDLIQEALRSAGIKYSIRVQTKNPPVVNRVNAVTAAMRTKAGVGLIINPECKGIIKDFMQVIYTASGDIDKRNLKLTHLSDAAGYCIWLETALKMNEAPNFIPTLNR
jgi:hypothetical protein